MSLLALWRQDREQIEEKRLDQLISFAGDGRLLDGGPTSIELRELLAAAPSGLLRRWKDEALAIRYEDFGLVLQDLVNEVGRRLGFELQYGRYRGRSGEDGHDGIWRAGNGHVLLVETKTSSNHRIELRKLADARRRFVAQAAVTDERVSTLIIIAEEGTEELESQVRGSRSAWEVRLLGVEALYKLLSVRESLDDDAVERRIQELLVPQEFTRLDPIIDLVFATAEDVQDDDDQEAVAADEGEAEPLHTRSVAANFHAEILPKLERHLRTPLVKRSRVLWSSPDNATLVSCQVSKTYPGHSASLYWFGLKAGTEQRLASHGGAMCAFGLGSPAEVVLLPFEIIRQNIGAFLVTQRPDGEVGHWHIKFRKSGDRIDLLTEGGSAGTDVRQYLLEPYLPR